MILTTNNDPSSPLSSRDVALLRDDCDDVTTFMEAGWFCVIGYRGSKRLVNAHCRDRRDYERAMGIYRSGSFYGDAAGGGYLVEASADYRVDGRTTETVVAYYSSEDLAPEDREAICRDAEENFRPAASGEERVIRLLRGNWHDLPRSQQVTRVGELSVPFVR